MAREEVDEIRYAIDRFNPKRFGSFVGSPVVNQQQEALFQGEVDCSPLTKPITMLSV